MKALVLCGGIPQAALIQELKKRGIYTVLADMNDKVVAKQYADEFYPVSVLDVNGIRKLAVDQKVDFILTACADQVLLVQAQVSEMLGLPCYISYETAKAVSSKALMKKVFMANDIPTSKYVIMAELDLEQVRELRYPLIVKPVDSYSSRGVKKVQSVAELRDAFDVAIGISRTNTAIIEEYVEGEELTVDVYVENGKAHVLCVSNIDKIPGNDCFVICRTRYPAQITEEISAQIEKVAGDIATAFGLRDTPMLIQLIHDGKGISIVEFCARTGGGDKFRLIKQVSGFDVIQCLVDLTLGIKPHAEPYRLREVIVNEFLYTKTGELDHFEGFEELHNQNVISEYYQLKLPGNKFGEIRSSGDRAAYYTIRAANIEEARRLDRIANETLKIIDRDGNDILRHDLPAAY